VKHVPFGRTGLVVPPIVFGTSCLGNLYQALPWETKREILREFFARVPAPVVLDTAGKYGAGLALEAIGRGMRELGIPSDRVVISNKLGWYRVPLRGPEPTFEPGAWAGIEHDAEQRIDAEGIRACWLQGRALLGAPYAPVLVSVHDPDEYLARASSPEDRERRWENVVGAYRTLQALKREGAVRAIGVGAKDWSVIREIAGAVELDWVMFACSLTILHHPPDLIAFMESLRDRGVGIINSAVFHAGFLTGGAFFDYRRADPGAEADRPLFAWRERFNALCARHGVAPAAACVRFGLSGPGVCAVALNTGKPGRVAENVALVEAEIPPAFWHEMKAAGLIARDYPYVG